MEYQKIINLLGNTPNQTTKFRIKKWVKINDDERGTYKSNGQIKFKTSKWKSSLCDYSDAYILVNRTITVAELVAGGGNNNKKITLKNCAPYTDSISEINNLEVNNVKDIDIIMLMYNLIECSDNYLKISGILWQYYRDEPSIANMVPLLILLVLIIRVNRLNINKK